MLTGGRTHQAILASGPQCRTGPPHESLEHLEGTVEAKVGLSHG